MKKTPFYRRGGTESPNAGLKEKIVWQLSKRPMTGMELAGIFGLPLGIIRQSMYDTIIRAQIVKVTASNEHIREDGAKDWLYTMERKPKRLVRKAPEKTKFFMSRRSLFSILGNNRARHVAEAERRAELIKSDVYISG